jgi:RNA polymerase sigma-70 factor (ECF subfamily)
MTTESISMENSPETRFSLIGSLSDADNVDAWNEFAQIYQPLIFRIARRRGLQHADAAEVTQEVLSRVVRAVDNWKPDRSKGSFRGWLYRITRNATIDHLRKAGRQPLSMESLVVTAAEVPAEGDQCSREFRLEYRKQVFAWAARRVQCEFRTRTWQAFWLTAVEGNAVNEVAADLGMTAGAIYVARSRVMKRLAEEVAKRNDDSMLEGPDSEVAS